MEPPTKSRSGVFLAGQLELARQKNSIATNEYSIRSLEFRISQFMNQLSGFVLRRVLKRSGLFRAVKRPFIVFKPLERT